MKMFHIVLRDSWQSLVRHPLRSVLVATTFALGLASVVAIVGTVEGGRRAISHDLESLGTDLIALINPVRLGSLAVGVDAAGRPLNREDAVEIQKKLEQVTDSVSPLRIDLGLTFTQVGEARHTTVSTVPRFISVLKPGMLAGRFLQDEDRWPDTRTGVVPAAIDEALAASIFGDPLLAMGEELRCYRSGGAFQVHIIGVVKDPLLLRQYMSAFDSTSSARAIPARRLQFLNLYLPWRADQDEPMMLLIDVPGIDDVDAVAKQLEEWIEQREIGVFLHIQKLWTSQVIGIIDRFRGVGHFVWILDLIVVLILTGTISLLAIDESLEEVALKRAEGASISDVVLPILLEGVLLSLASMLPGILLGKWILEAGISPVLGWDPWLPLPVISGTCAAILLTALLGSVLPAIRVARLEPASVLGRRRDL